MYTKARKTAFRTNRTRHKRQSGGLTGTKQEQVLSLGLSTIISLLDYLFGAGAVVKPDPAKGQPILSQVQSQIQAGPPIPSNVPLNVPSNKTETPEQQTEQVQEQAKAVEQKRKLMEKQSGRRNYWLIKY